MSVVPPSEATRFISNCSKFPSANLSVQIVPASGAAPVLPLKFSPAPPVNLNFTAGDKAVASSIQQADLDKFITADPFVRKMSSFNWPPNRELILIDRVDRTAASGAAKICNIAVIQQNAVNGSVRRCLGSIPKTDTQPWFGLNHKTTGPGGSVLNIGDKVGETRV